MEVGCRTKAGKRIVRRKMTGMNENVAAIESS